jgi:GNAT superfamily N-acetyltransferase
VAPVVRAARHEDLAGLLALLSQLHDEREPIGPTAALASTFAEMLATPGRTVLVAEDRGGLIGTLDLSVSANLTYDGRPWADVEKVVVDRDHRRGGVGRALLEQALTLAREAGCYKLQLISRGDRTGALAFYEELGLEPRPGYRLYL